MSTNFVPMVIASEDLSHHMLVIGTSCGGVDTTPVGLVDRGVFPESYLDKFTSDSIYFDSIAEWKLERSNDAARIRLNNVLKGLVANACDHSDDLLVMSVTVE